MLAHACRSERHSLAVPALLQRRVELAAAYYVLVRPEVEELLLPMGVALTASIRSLESFLSVCTQS